MGGSRTPIITREASNQDLNGNVRETAQTSIVGQKQSAAMFNGSRQMEGIKCLESMSGANGRGPITYCWRHWQHLNIRGSEKGVELGQQYATASFERPNMTLHPHQIAYSHPLAAGKQGCDPGSGKWPPDRWLFHQVDYRTGIQKHH